ncbi:MAG: hypothetical protein MMC33_004068 [Icmadophila ericetorum]|nr:hypothetical protein [Icmadophila ericetorum]
MSITQHRLTLHPLPPRLQYGPDPGLGVTDPTRYGTSSSSRRPSESFNPRIAGRLPSLSTILIHDAQSSTQVSRAAPIRDADRYQRTPPYDQYEFSGYSSKNSNVPSRSQQYSSPERDSRDTANDRGRDAMGFTGASLNTPGSRYQHGFGHREGNPAVYSSGTDNFQQPISMPPSSSSSHAPYRGQSSSSTAGDSPRSLSGYSVTDSQAATKPLLQVVGEENVPGEGPCYVYADGSRLRKIIDGEAVNAQWGVTKAGKPRKRLAIACLTCREKKIKCEPGEPKCTQCEKSGRDCRFHTA